ncbi:MAG TPA: C-type lectin domain-containing protein [Polyangiaceae bacterium]|nr:C-type lectin domain-containing protein [Polyangiaceae bacterium]
MLPRLGTLAGHRSSWATVAVLGIVVACSGKDKSFFDAPPIAHTTGGKAGATSGKAGRAGIGGGAGTALGKGGGATSGETGGAMDGMAGAGEGGMPATGGSGGSGAHGGSMAGGSTATGGSGGAGLGGTTTIGGSGGAGAGGTAGNGGSGTAGLGASAGTGGLGGSSGLGGTGATAGLGGAGASAGMGGASTCVPTVPSTEICDGIDNDCHGGIDGPGVCPDGCFGAIYDDHRYLLCIGVGNYTYTRTEAHDACVSHGDHLDTTLDLVRVNSAEENAFVLGFIADHDVSDPVWNGASDSSMSSVGSSEGTWVWGSSDNGATFYRDDSPVSDRYNDWAPGQPDNDGSGTGEDCAVFDPAKNWHWDDVSCSDETSTFVCEEPH